MAARSMKQRIKKMGGPFPGSSKFSGKGPAVMGDRLTTRTKRTNLRRKILAARLNDREEDLR